MPETKSMRLLASALSLMGKRYEQGLDNKDVDQQPIEIVYEFADILRATIKLLKDAGYVR